jgi:hypothetical protein
MTLRMRLERDADGHLWLRDLPPLCADTVLRLPGWLENEDPLVRRRLLPQVFADAAEEEQWRRYGASELEYLFLSRAEILRKDLESLAAESPATTTFKLRIQRGHEAAWLSSLNGGRLALFTMHGLADADMGRDPSSLRNPEHELALVRIHLMAWVQELLLDQKGLGSTGSAEAAADDDA